MCWTDGGNSVLGRDPQDLDKNIAKSELFKGAYSNVLGGMSTMVMKVHVPSRKAVSATYMSSHVFNHAIDAWGRLYAGKQMSRKWASANQQDHFGLGAEVNGSGLFVLDDDLRTNIFHAMVGGTSATRQTSASSPSMATLPSLAATPMQNP